MAFDVVGDVALENEVAYPVSRDGPVVGVVDGTVPDVGAPHGVTQVEVDGVAT